MAFIPYLVPMLAMMTTFVVSQSSNTSFPTLKILVGGYNATTAVLEFDPYSEPNTLEVISYGDTEEGYFKPWLSRHPVNPQLILGCNDDPFGGPGYLSSYTLDEATGALTFIDSVNTGGHPAEFGIGATHCDFFPSGTVAGVANFYGQSAAFFEFEPSTGFFGDELSIGVVDFPGYIPVEGQVNSTQDASHPHQILTHPWLPVLYIPDLGEDLLRLYSIGDDGSLSNLTTYQQPYGSGPRHASISPNGQYLYLLQELTLVLRVYEIDEATGELDLIQDDLPIYPSNVTVSLSLTAAEIHVSNDGRFLYATNRNFTGFPDPSIIQEGDPSDTIAVFSVSRNGTVAKVQNVVAPGARIIRALELSPAITTASAGGQDFVVAGGMTSNNTFVFRRDRANGTLSLAAQVDGTYWPSTFLWLG